MAKEQNLKSWKPGQSGNPAGKPKGTKNLSTWISEMMTDENFEYKLDDGTLVKEAPIKAIIKVAISKAVNGDDRSRDWLAKYGWGDKLIHETNEPQKIIVETRKLQRST